MFSLLFSYPSPAGTTVAFPPLVRCSFFCLASFISSFCLASFISSFCLASFISSFCLALFISSFCLASFISSFCFHLSAWSRSLFIHTFLESSSPDNLQDPLRTSSAYTCVANLILIGLTLSSSYLPIL